MEEENGILKIDHEMAFGFILFIDSRTAYDDDPPLGLSAALELKNSIDGRASVVAGVVERALWTLQSRERRSSH